MSKVDLFDRPLWYVLSYKNRINFLANMEPDSYKSRQGKRPDGIRQDDVEGYANA